MNRRSVKKLAGKTIRDIVLVDVDIDVAHTGTVTRPYIQFDDGSWMTFVTDETDSGDDYGVSLIYPARPPPGSKRAKGVEP